MSTKPQDVVDEIAELRNQESYLAAYLCREYANLRPLRERRDGLRRLIAELEGKPVLPGRRFQTQVQQRVQVCPRCQGLLSDTPPSIARANSNEEEAR